MKKKNSSFFTFFLPRAQAQMKVFFVLLIAVLLASSLGVSTAALTTSEKHNLFATFLKDFDKNYELDQLLHRLDIFMKNLDYIIKFNTESKQSGHQNPIQLGINQFTDLTNEEFVKLQVLDKKKMAQTRQKKHKLSNLSSQSTQYDCPHFKQEKLMSTNQIDWTATPYVSPVANQGGCGSCFLFSALAPLETRIAIQSKTNATKLSEQYILDCCSKHCGTCSTGGIMRPTYDWLIDKNLCAESDYPYEAKDLACREDRCRKSEYTVQGYKAFDTYADMLDGIQINPLSVALVANTLPFQLYKSGILTVANGGCKLAPDDESNHAVVIVGYKIAQNEDGTQTPYWIVRNSWGEGWGSKELPGHIFIEAGTNCLFIEEPEIASFPLIKRL